MKALITTNQALHLLQARNRPAVSIEGPDPGSQPVVSRSPHEVELEVHRRLRNHPDLTIAQLHVHQCPQGICLEGFVIPRNNNVDICEILQDIEGVTTVINRIVSPKTCQKLETTTQD